MSHVVVLAHSKGGTGKTTSATQLADELGITNIADIDSHKGLSIINRMRPEHRRWNLVDCSSEEALAAAICAARDGNEPLLIDCGGFDSRLARIAIGLATIVITPANDDITEQIGLSKFNSVIEDINKRNGTSVKAHVLMTRTHPSRRNFDVITAEVNKAPNLTMLKSRLSSRAIFPLMMARHGSGVTAFTKNLGSEAYSEVKELGNEIRGILGIH
ncbi:TPA: ParA family protein [Aeromonas veronii]